MKYGQEIKESLESNNHHFELFRNHIESFDEKFT